MNKQRIELFVKGLIYATFFVPLIVIPSSYIFPFIVPKIVFFRGLVEVMLAGYVLLLCINWRQYAPKNTFLNLALLCFVLSFGISTFVGVDAYHSFWDNHERMLGFLTILHYAAFYFVAQGVFKDLKDWRWAGRVFLLGGFLVMFIAWMQTQNPQLLLNNGADRVISTLGNPIYVGGYGLFLFFLALLLSSTDKNTLWRWYYGITGLFGFFGIFWSGTRGALLGMAVAAAFALVSYIFVLKKYPKLRYGLVGLLILGIAGVSLLYSYKQTNFVKNLPAVGRTVNTSLEDVKNSPRWIAWGIAVQSFKEKPLFGWGPNNYFYAFNAHYNPKSLDYGYGETWFDNAHNILLNTLAVQGAFGLITYLALYAAAIITLFSAYRAKRIDYNFAIIAAAFLVAHFVSVITVFEDPTSYVYMMFWFALVNSVSRKTMESGMRSDKELSSGALVAVSVVFALFVFIFNVQPARANQKALNAIRIAGMDPVAGFDVIKGALDFNSPHIDDIRSDVGRSVAQSLSANWEKIGRAKSNEILNLAAENLEKNLTLHPLDIRNQLTLAEMYQLQAQINSSGIYVFKAENLTQDALNKSPKRQQIVYGLSGLKMQMNKIDEAKELLEGAIIDNPRIGESYWRLAYIYKIKGDQEKMIEILHDAKKNGIIFTEREQNIINQLFLSMTTSKK